MHIILQNKKRKENIFNILICHNIIQGDIVVSMESITHSEWRGRHCIILYICTLCQLSIII